MNLISVKNLQNFLKILGEEYYRDGIYYYKILEYLLVVREIDFRKHPCILDIGCGKSFLPLYYLYRGSQVWVVDNGEFYSDFDKFYRGILDSKLFLDGDRMNIIWGNFQDIDFPVNHFDVITAVSTLEHLKSGADMNAVMKIGSLLKKGGSCIVSLPFSQSGTKERFLSNNNGAYFQRDYELNCVFKRIIEPSGLNLKYFYVIGERFPLLGKKFFFGKLLSRHRNLWARLLAGLFWEVYYKGSDLKIPQFKYPGVIIAILEK